MKPNEYINKYDLKNRASYLDRNEFVTDLASDFVSMLQYHQASGNWNYAKFQVCVTDIRAKFDSVWRKSNHPGITEKFWGYFFATVVVKYRDSMFGDFLRQRKEQYEEKKREQREYRRWVSGEAFFDDFYEQLLRGLLGDRQRRAPVESFVALGIPETSTLEEIKKAYRGLALRYHPDQGGDANKFRQIVEAKNRCVAYAAN